MNRTRLMIAALSLAALVAAALACGSPETFSRVAVPFTVTIERAAVRPYGSGVGIVGNHTSLGATADHPEGDPIHALQLRQLPDDTWVGAAWLTPGQDVDYVVYMTNPAASEGFPSVLPDGGVVADAGAGPMVRHITWEGREPVEPATNHVTVFNPPANVSKPCITFVLHVPDNTPSGDTIYLAGNDPQLGPWLPGTYALTKNADGTYGSEVCFDPGKELHYKYVRNGDWAYVEKAADGSERPDRVISVADTGIQADTVEKWADL